MTLSRYTTYCGIAADRVNAQLSAAIIATATSLPLTNLNDQASVLTAEGASYSAIIIDGPLTETVAITGNLSGGAVACAATANAHSAFVYVAFQLTASIGPTAYMPLETFKPEDTYDQLYDEAAVGSLVPNRGAVQGKRQSSFELAGAVFADTFGYVLGGVYGSEDYSAGTPSVHAFAILNASGSSGQIGQPVRYLLYNYDAYNTRVFSGRFTGVNVTMDPRALLKFTAKFLGRASGVVANPTKSFSAITPLPSWYGYATIGGVTVGKVLTCEIDLEREEAENIPTLSTNQDPWDTFVGALPTKGKFSLVFDDDTQLNQYFNATQPVVVLNFTRVGAVTQQLKVQMTGCNYEKATVVQQGKAYVSEDIEFQGLGNATDATTSGGGLSTSKTTLENAVASATTYT